MYNKPQKNVLIIIVLLIFFLLTSMIYLAYQGRQVIRSRAQHTAPTTAPTAAPSPVCNPPTPFPVPVGCQRLAANIRKIECPATSADMLTGAKFLFQSYRCGPDGQEIMLTNCVDPASCPQECRSGCDLQMAEMIIRNRCLVFSAENCIPAPTVTNTPTPTPFCAEGVERVIPPELCVSEPTPTTSGHSTAPPGGNIDVVTPAAPAVKQRLVGVKCWDGSSEQVSSECLEPEQIAQKIREIIEGGNYCIDKKSPGCYQIPTPSTFIIPTEALSGSPVISVTLVPDLILTPISPELTKPVVTLPKQGECFLKPAGDCNCDGLLDLADFECLRRQIIGKDSCRSADFNEDGNCDLVDFNIYRVNLFSNKINN